jgi:hypothetical protein
MNYIDTSIDIEAPAATVWAALTDFAAYPEWNPRSHVTGVAAPGERLVVAPGPEAAGMPTFRPRVLAAGPVTDGVDSEDAAAAGPVTDGVDSEDAAADGPVTDGPAPEAYELRWLGHLWVPGLFDGEHSFRVEPIDEHRSRLTQSESFSGVLAGLLLRRYGADTEAGFHAVNEALKTRAEGLTAASDADAPAA